MKKLLLSTLLIFTSLTLLIKYYAPTQFYVEKNLPKYGQITRTLKKYPPILKLVDGNNEFFCTGFVIDDNYAVTAGHCLDLGGPRTNIIILSENNLDTHIIGTTAGFSHRMDYGLIKGDFKEFIPAAIDLTLETAYTESRLLTCGFPMGVKKAICYPIVLQGNDLFGVAVGGFLFPGMSGGPAVNLDSNKVFGVNSRVSLGHVVIQPLVGILATFGIEP